MVPGIVWKSARQLQISSVRFVARVESAGVPLTFTFNENVVLRYRLVRNLYSQFVG